MSEVTFGSFELWRQDDYGQRYLVGRYPTLAAAERHLTGLTRGQHKQTYWVVEADSHTEQANPV